MSFDLVTSPEQLAYAREKQSGSSWQQFLPTSSAVGANFSAGSINFPVSLQAPMWWQPSKTYVRLVVNTSYPQVLANPGDTGTAAGSPFLPHMSTAPSFLQGMSLFSRASFSCNGQMVSQINDNYAQIGAFTERVLKPDAQVKNFWDGQDFTNATFAARQNTVTMPNMLTPGPNDNDLTVSIYDVGVAYPSSVQVVNATLAGAQLTISAPAVLAPGSFAQLSAYLRQGQRITILQGAAEPVAVSGTVEQWAGAATEIVITLGNIEGLDINVGEATLPAQVFITSLNPTKVISNTYEILTVPPLSIFQYGGLIPGGSFMNLELQAFPQSVFQTRAVETLGLNKVQGRDFQVTILECSLFMYVCSGPRVDQSISFMLELPYCVEMSTQALTSQGTNNLIFNCSPSTYCIGVALQNRSLDVSQASSTRFTVGYPANSPGLENSISRLFVTYRGVTQPPQLQSLGYKEYEEGKNDNSPATAGVNLQVIRWQQNQLIDGLGFSAGGSEDFATWQERGGLYLFYFPADASAESNRCQVTIACDKDLTGTVPGSVGANVLLFSISRQVATVSMEAGRWTSVNLTNL